MALQYFQQYSKKSATLLLDLYPGAVLAVSLRKLRTAYAGACIRVRNSIGNESDIGFVGNFVDVATWTTFLNGQPGTIVNGYDQSLIGNNATQPVLINQPACVLSDSGLNNRPSISFAGNDYLTFPYLFGSAQTNCSIFVVNKSTGAAPIISDTNGASYSVVGDWYNTILIQGIDPGYDQYSPNAQANYGYLSCLISGDSNNKIYKNGVQLSAGAGAARQLQFNSIGYWAAANIYMNGSISDIIVYPTKMSDACRLKFEADARTDYNLP